MSPRLLVLGALCLTLGAVLLAGRREAETRAFPMLTLPAFSDLRAITIERPRTPPATIQRVGEGWQVAAPYSAPADADRLAAVEQALTAPLAAEHAAPLAEAERGEFGLAGEGVVVTLTPQSGEPLRLRLGKVASGRRTFVALEPPGPSTRFVYRLAAHLPKLFDHAPESWREHRLHRLRGEDLSRLELSAGDVPRWTAVREAAGRPWRLLHPVGLDASDAEISGVAHTFATLAAESFLPATTPFVPVLKVRATGFDGRAHAIELAPDPDGGARARREGTTELVRLPARLVAFLDRDAATLRERRLLDVRAAQVRIAELRFEADPSIRLVRDEDHHWRLEAPVLVNPVSPDRVMPVLERITEIETAGVATDAPADAFAHPYAVVDLTLVDGRKVTLTLGAEAADHARYARTSSRPDRIYWVGPVALRGLRPGIDTFRAAASP